MKKIVNNKDSLEEKDINNIIKRAKIVLINSNNEIILANALNTYFLVGGRVEENESDIETLKREMLEESGIILKEDNLKPFCSVIHLKKDYPEKDINTKYIANYYYLKIDDKIDYNKIKLTEEEKENNFKLSYVHIDKIIDILKENTEVTIRPTVVKDTLNAIEEFIRIYK